MGRRMQRQGHWCDLVNRNGAVIWLQGGLQSMYIALPHVTIHMPLVLCSRPLLAHLNTTAVLYLSSSSILAVFNAPSRQGSSQHHVDRPIVEPTR